MKVNHPGGGAPKYYYKYKIIKSNILIIYFQNILTVKRSQGTKLLVSEHLIILFYSLFLLIDLFDDHKGVCDQNLKLSVVISR